MAKDNQTPNSSVRSVKAVTPDAPREGGTPSSGGGRSGNFLVRAKDAVMSVGYGVGGGIARGVRTASKSWFGLKPIGHSISGMVGKSASFMNVSKKTMAVGMAASLLFGAGAMTVGFLNSSQTEFMVKQDEYYDECVEDYQATLKKNADYVPTGDIEGQMLENAQKLWALGKHLGMTDEQCAGMLGCLEAESGWFDPTSIETIYTEPFSVDGPRKRPFIDAGIPSAYMTNFVTGEMNTKYLNSGIHIHLNSYKDDKSDEYCAGIGIVAWTGPTAFRLVEYAEAQGRNWWEFDVQCANIIANDKRRLEGFLREMAGRDSVREATAAWFGWMERGLGRPTYDGHYEKRLRFAEEWYARFSASSDSIEATNSEFADSVLDLAATTVQVANTKHANAVREDCVAAEEVATPDNSNLATAAVAYAWETTQMGVGNNGTALFRAVHDAMYPGDIYYMSCDRGVACAVLWSGADDFYPAGATSTQLVYMRSHPDLWEEVGPLASNMNNLQPGDILITDPSGHIVMYVGNEEVTKKYPSSRATCVSASLGTRSPGCGDNDAPTWYVTGDGRYYVVFRYIGAYDGAKKDLYVGTASGTSG